jgi:hypothetical protein
VAKSNRRRKQDRAKRQVRDNQKQAATQRQEDWQQGQADRADQVKRLSDPATPVAELVVLLNERYDGEPVFGFEVDRLKSFGWSTERLVSVADALLADGASDEPSLTALTFASEVARETGDTERARALLDQAFEAPAASDGLTRLNLISLLRFAGWQAEAITLIEASLRDDPDARYLAELYGVAISELHERANGQQPANGCSCGSGNPWEQCCGPREQAALSRFTDRSGLTALTDALSAFLSDSDYGRAIDEQLVPYLAAVESLELTPVELDTFRSLIAEHALIAADAEAGTPIEAFAAGPSVPAELAARARDWQSHFRYGLWKVDLDSEPPGLWCTDICTSELRYADFPANFTDGWPRWSVWLGGLVPVDGIWSATGTGLRLAPAEADAASEFVETAVIDVVHSLAGKKRPPRRPGEPMPFGKAEPHGVLVEQQDPIPPAVGSVTVSAIGQLLWRICQDVYAYRRVMPPVGRADVGEGWEQLWIDAPVTRLNGRTPRQTAASRDWPLLEALLRQFEYDADLLAAQGQPGIDTDWLRQELDMTIKPLDD